mgnify:CR=1 FL=1
MEEYFRSFRRQLHQFRNSFDVPVGVYRLFVPEISAQFVHFSIDIEISFVPVDDCVDRKSMSKIMDPWSGAMPLEAGRFS